MIKILKKATSPVPDILLNNGKNATAILTTRFDNGNNSFESKDFNGEIYGHNLVKESLIQIQDYKCCFCESKIGHISYGDVEHFRPKAGWVQDNEPINKPGYYWLAYDWDNLLLSCQICNQRFKKNFFPLIDATKRALSHHFNITIEQPLFLHPAIDEIENFITFKEEIPIAIQNNLRGSITIKKLGLDRDLLNDQRRSTLEKIRTIYDLAKGYPDTYPALKQEAKKKVEKFYNQSLSDSTEYASMLRAFFRDNPLDF